MYERLTDVGDIAVAIGNGSVAQATGGILDTAFADGTDSEAFAEGGSFDSATAVGNSITVAGFGNGDVASAVNTGSAFDSAQAGGVAGKGASVVHSLAWNGRPMCGGRRPGNLISSIDLRWDVVTVDAAVVAGERPCVLLISPGGDRQARIVSGVDPASRVERQPQQHSEQHRSAARNRDPHPELDDRADDDQQHERRTEATAAALAAHGCGT